MSYQGDDRFDGIEISLYELLDPITRRPDLDFEIEVDRDDYASASEIVVEIREALTEGGVQDCVVLERKRTEFDWGASGVGEAILVGIGSAYAAEGIKAIIKRLVGEQDEAGHMSETDAIQHVRYRLTVRYDIDGAQLQLVSVATTDDGVEVTLRNPTGAPLYRANVVGSGLGARATRIERVVIPEVT